MAETPVQAAAQTTQAQAAAPAPVQATTATALTPKTLGNTDVNGAAVNVSDLTVFGDGDTFKLICKASSQKEGWMKSTKACEIIGVGCIVQVTTQQRNPDGTYAVAEALTFVPGIRIQEDQKEGEAKVRSFIQY